MKERADEYNETSVKKLLREPLCPPCLRGNNAEQTLKNTDEQGEAIGFALQPMKKANKQDMEEHRGK